MRVSRRSLSGKRGRQPGVVEPHAEDGSRRHARSAPAGRGAARRSGRAGRRRARGRSGLCATQGRHRAAHIRRRRRAAARRLLRAQRRDATIARPVSERRGAYRSCRAHALSRALALRRAGCARKRSARRRQARGRLAQSCACPVCPTPGGPIRAALPSARWCRSSCAAGPRCCPGFRKCTACPCASPRLHGSWISMPRPIRCWRVRLPRAWRSTASPTRTPAHRPGDLRQRQTPAERLNRQFTEAAEAAAKFLSTADGPRIGVLSYDGWDTHANEGPVKGQLALRLGSLDAAIAALKNRNGNSVARHRLPSSSPSSAAPRASTARKAPTMAWPRSRLWSGGAVKGGRVLADWPGLREAALYEGRDLAPTRDLRTVLKGVLRDHLGIPDGALAGGIFPDSAAARPLDGLSLEEHMPARTRALAALPAGTCPNHADY